MSKHSHNFVETYDGLIGFGFDRETDENTITCYLQKFSDDMLMEKLIKRMSNGELEDVFNLLTLILKKHLSETEYHKFFLKD